MSTILKALRRLEREKQPDPARPLREDVVAHTSEPQAATADPLGWMRTLGLGLILVLGILWLSSAPWRSGRGPTAGPAPTVAVRPEPAAPAARAMPPAATGPSAPAAAPAPAPPRAATPGPSEPAAAPAPAPPRAAKELPYRLPDPEPLEAFAAPVVPAPTHQPTAGSEPEPEVSVVRPSPPPAPAARVDSTTWHPVGERRRAVVSAPGRAGVTLREGDALGELVVLRIEPAGVVFVYRGQEVRRAVGE